MKKQSSSIKKGIICCLSLFCSLSIQAQKLGDYIEIDSVPAFIFYIDNTGKHGLAMSMPAVYSDMLKKIDKYVKKGLIDKRQAELSKKGNVIDIKNYEESGMLKPKNKQKLFENLIPKLTEKGEENAGNGIRGTEKAGRVWWKLEAEKHKRKSDARNTVDGKMLTAINISRVNRGETDAKLSVCP